MDQELEVTTPDIDLKKHKTAKKLLVTGLVFAIIGFVGCAAISLLSIIIGLAVAAIAAGFVAVVIALITGIFGGSGSSEPANIGPQFGKILLPFGIVSFVFFIFALALLVGLILAIVALAMFNTAKDKKKGMVAGILAIISGISLLFIPVELIGGIFALRVSAEQYAAAYSIRKTKKEMKKHKKEQPQQDVEVLDYTNEEEGK